MKVILLRPVGEFLDSLDTSVRADTLRLIELLEEYGHALPMPYAKPLGGRLWELRRTGRPQIRILYGFHRGQAVLVHAITKGRSALRRRDVALARNRLSAYCG